MKRLGLTGGIGVGKTYVSKVFQQLGVPVFNADVEAKRCMVEDNVLIEKVKKYFGENMYKDGLFQKEKLAKIVFNNRKKLAELNTLVHPLVKQKFIDWCSEQDALIVIKEAAILFESDAHVGLDFVICVSASEKLRIARVQKRDGISITEIKSRMDKQMLQSEKEELADFIIINDSETLLIPQIIRVLKEME